MIGVMLVVCTIIIVFFIVFQKRKNKLLLDKIKMQQAFERAFAETNEEIQEQTLKYIGQELHDNIGQLLSVANMQLSILNTEIPETLKERFSESKSAVKESLTEIRALSKSLNRDVIQNKGVYDSIQSEINRLNRMKLIKAELIKTGDNTVTENSKDAIILFRILQEFISNTVKYSNAKQLKIHLNYYPEKLIIHASDDGVGFDEKTVESNSGLVNMKSRAELIEASFSLASKPNQGVHLTLEYPLLKRVV
ncbi:histidine kinase [Lacinutrix sp. C3R15]|nr:histidine kinase [Lacinutrix sp. C3R15]